MRHVAFALIALGILGGCATMISSGTSSVNAIELDARGGDGAEYFLFDGTHYPIARTISRNGKISFELPADRYVSRCVMVTDKERKPVLEGKKSVYLAVRVEYQALSQQRLSVLSDANAATSAERYARTQQDAAYERLRSNRSLVQSSCTLPAQRQEPPRPYVRCGSRQECLQDGAAICFTRYLGSKGCGRASREFGIPGLLSSPGCGAAAAALAGDKYDLGDAVVDLLHGMAEDKARELRRSDSFGEQLFGALITGVSEGIQLNEAKACTNRFVEKQFAPLTAWAANVEQIRAEPRQLQASCQRDMASLPELASRLASATSRANEARSRVSAFDARLAGLQRERRPIEWCKG